MPQKYDTDYDRKLVARIRRAAKSGLEVFSIKSSSLDYYECYIEEVITTGSFMLAGMTSDRRVHRLVCRISQGYHSATLQPTSG